MWWEDGVRIVPASFPHRSHIVPAEFIFCVPPFPERSGIIPASFSHPSTVAQAFLFVRQRNTDRNGHGPCFRAHMRRINQHHRQVSCGGGGGGGAGGGGDWWWEWKVVSVCSDVESTP